uniref:Uncharacterized protein n=1 Tax=Onchocerca volvulus TaxID=6282 RepID=A0A8R1XLP7_ONCVO
MYLIGLNTIAILAICFGDMACGYAIRQKKQLAPSVQLEDNINSILRLDELGLKRSFGSPEHVSPALGLGGGLDDLLSLQSIGKRPALSPADQFVQKFDTMQQLMTAGKKRSLSPAIDLEERVQIPQMLIDIGR